MVPYPDVRMVDVVFVQCDLGMAGLLVLHKVPGSGGSRGEIWIHKPHTNTLKVEQNGESFTD